ncbi:aminomethyltransferase [Microbacterium endophyticum]|uniref:Aminomethyltransferase n=1 Tax=Microbacterium endophyticum TaxID=1526412 RepID=A0A7W4V0Y2_9MICO|nr:glycine cleavage system aminomethyltransferase GcvT [Microbacterium endophyticum]MBB2974802.1 aminomethyltransferase [Microbacterium endophyticum]NIK37099.1 aminomethyltransferase [Microbacterium endophyticum]
MTSAVPTESPSPEVRRSPLHAAHEALGASFTDFGGWLMPVRYTSDLAEHHAVRSAAGIFDISHMGEFFVEGPEAGRFLDVALAGRISALVDDQAKYSLVLDENGGIVDDVIVYRFSAEKIMVVANAGNRDAVATALHERVGGFDVRLVDASDDLALIAVQGPASQAILAATAQLTVTSGDLEQLKYYRLGHGEFHAEGGAPVAVQIARTGYTGEDGFEIYVPAASAVSLWHTLLSVGSEHGIVPAGLAARDTLRLEAGMPLYGHELSRDIRPAQAGLARVVVLDKPKFVGRTALAASSDDASSDDAAPVLVGLTSTGRRAGRAGYAVYSGDDLVGEVTSGALSPTLGHPIAMAYVAPAVAAPGTELALDVRGTRIPATVTALPFYRRKK